MVKRRRKRSAVYHRDAIEVSDALAKDGRRCLWPEQREDVGRCSGFVQLLEGLRSPCDRIVKPRFSGDTAGRSLDQDLPLSGVPEVTCPTEREVVDGDHPGRLRLTNGCGDHLDGLTLLWLSC